MLLPFWSLVSAGLILQGSTPPSKSWIADVKASQGNLGTREVLIEGDVVDIRSTSAAARAGFYRIIDASDPAGVLLRSDRLPRDGGALRVRARLAAQQPTGGPLLLDEIEQQRLDQRPVTPLILGLASLLGFAIVLVLFSRTVRAESRYLRRAPLWLLPHGSESAPVPAEPDSALKYSPELEEQDRREQERFWKRKRNLLEMAVGSLALVAANGVWLSISKPAAALVPEFIFIEASNLPVPAAVALGPSPDTTLMLSTVLQRMGTMASRRDSALIHAKSGTQTSSLALLQPNSPAQTRGTVADSALDPRPLSTPSPAPVSFPAPVPPPAPGPAPAPPAPDAAVERGLAAGVVSEAAGSLVQAINAGRISEVSALLPQTLSEDKGQRAGLLTLISDFSPRATLGSIEEVTLSEDRGEARFTISLAWRGDFGVGRTMASRFLGLVHRQGEAWRFEGARLLAEARTTSSQSAPTSTAVSNPSLPNGPATRTINSEATQALATAAKQLVAAVNGQQIADLSRLLPESLAGDRGRRNRFLKLINDFTPQAQLARVEEVTVAEDRGEARFSVELSWRGDFGVVRRKAGQFLGIIRRQGTDWQFDGAQLLDAIP